MSGFDPQIKSTEYIARAYPEKDGQHSGNTVLGVTGTGEEVYIKQKRSYEGSNLLAGRVLEELPVRSPRVSYKDNKVIFESLENFKPVEKIDGQIDTESYLEAVAAKFIVGDYDLSWNILYLEKEQAGSGAPTANLAAPVDYDWAGNTLSSTEGSILREYKRHHEEIVGYDMGADDLRSKAVDLLRKSDLTRILSILENFDVINSEDARIVEGNVEELLEDQNLPTASH